MAKNELVFHLFIGSINEHQDCLGTKTLGVLLQIDHLIGTSTHAPLRLMVTHSGDTWDYIEDRPHNFEPADWRTYLVCGSDLVLPNLQSDEAHFWLNGYFNKQNCRIWSEANPQVYVETPLHPEKLTVWCALWAGGIIGPYFFKHDEGHNVTVNGDRYRAMITNFFIPELNNHDVQELWFQQYGATCHTARATINLLKDTFGDRLISRFGPVNWPPRSCDLTPLDYFLWGHVKSLVYADNPQTPDHLEDNIRRGIADIRHKCWKKSSKIGLHLSQPWQSYARNHI
ncbi:DUF4817 domain-containing protein [Trichonephila clavipes]|nr:DUF4817 domain-containing protein [Trichonephila clavipes]